MLKKVLPSISSLFLLRVTPTPRVSPSSLVRLVESKLGPLVAVFGLREARQLGSVPEKFPI